MASTTRHDLRGTRSSRIAVRKARSALAGGPSGRPASGDDLRGKNHCDRRNGARTPQYHPPSHRETRKRTVPGAVLASSVIAGLGQPRIRIPTPHTFELVGALAGNARVTPFAPTGSPDHYRTFLRRAVPATPIRRFSPATSDETGIHRSHPCHTIVPGPARSSKVNSTPLVWPSAIANRGRGLFPAPDRTGNGYTNSMASPENPYCRHSRMHIPADSPKANGQSKNAGTSTTPPARANSSCTS